MNKKLYVSLLGMAILLTSVQADARMTKEAHALYQEACNYEYKGDYTNAIGTIQKALNMNGDDAMLYTKIAGLYADTGNYEEALGAYKKALKIRPNDAFIYISIGNILQIIFAILVSRVTVKWFKKTSQTLMFMPYFVSFVILKVIVYNVFEYQYGLINNIITILFKK